MVAFDVGGVREWLQDEVTGFIVPEKDTAEMMRKYCITDGDLMGLLYDEMIGRKKIELFRGEGSFEFSFSCANGPCSSGIVERTAS